MCSSDLDKQCVELTNAPDIENKRIVQAFDGYLLCFGKYGSSIAFIYRLCRFLALNEGKAGKKQKKYMFLFHILFIFSVANLRFFRNINKNIVLIFAVLLNGFHKTFPSDLMRIRIDGFPDKRCFANDQLVGEQSPVT